MEIFFLFSETEVKKSDSVLNLHQIFDFCL